MKLFKHDASTPNEAKTPLSQMLKEDFFKALWLLMYIFLIFFIIYLLFSALPVIFSYAYTSIALIMGLDLSALTQANLVFWQMVSLSTGAVFIGLLIIALKKFFGWLTNKMIVKHVLKKSEFSNIIELKGKK